MVALTKDPEYSTRPNDECEITEFKTLTQGQYQYLKRRLPSPEHQRLREVLARESKFGQQELNFAEAEARVLAYFDEAEGVGEFFTKLSEQAKGSLDNLVGKVKKEDLRKPSFKKDSWHARQASFKEPWKKGGKRCGLR